jgi:hypothetical protein
VAPIPCGTANTAGTLSAASYSQSFAYDNLNRLTSGPLGNYAYGDAAHLHGATAIGGQWSGTYDASGNLTCRAPSSSTTCSGTQTGAQLSYDNEGRLSAWQNAPSSPTSTDSFLYDGEGNRVEQQVTASGTATTTMCCIAAGKCFPGWAAYPMRPTKAFGISARFDSKTDSNASTC